MVLPKVKFRYSWIYDQNWKIWLKVYDLTPVDLSFNQIYKRIERIEKSWSEHEKPILKEISTISNLPWREKEILCYVVSRCIPFSDPLTISANFDDASQAVDVLTHELIHRLFAQEGNMQKSKMAWDYFQKKYSNEYLNVITHVVVHAFHMHIFLKFFNKKRLEREVKSLELLPDYKRAWKIVFKEGYKEIIKSFAERVEK